MGRTAGLLATDSAPPTPIGPSPAARTTAAILPRRSGCGSGPGAGRGGLGRFASRGRSGAELKRRRACRDFKYRARCRKGWWKGSGLSFPTVNGAPGQRCARRTPGGVVRTPPPSRGDSMEVKGEVGGVAAAREEAPQCPARARKALRNRK